MQFQKRKGLLRSTSLLRQTKRAAANGKYGSDSWNGLSRVRRPAMAGRTGARVATAIIRKHTTNPVKSTVPALKVPCAVR